MPADQMAPEEIRRRVAEYERNGRNLSATARALGIARGTLQKNLRMAEKRGFLDRSKPPGAHQPNPGFIAPVLPNPDAPVEELIDRLCKNFKRRETAEEARKLIPIRITIPGPIAIVHMGDPHVDDDGTNWPLLKSHVEIIQNTHAMFGANVGDLQNNWVGRLARLYGNQSTSAREAWRLTQWLVQSIPWIYLILGNHDLWTGAGDPLEFMKREDSGPMEPWKVRLNLCFPNGREVRINARHDFPGNSMWNPAHGPMRATQTGWRDHILTCGHKHISGYGMLKDPASGLVTHAIRCGGYKIYDMHATVNGFPDGNFAPAAVTIIDPDAEDETGLVTVMWDVAMASRFLTSLRKDRGL